MFIIFRYTQENLELLVKKCKTYKEILEELDILPVTTNYNKLKGHKNYYYVHFCCCSERTRTFIILLQRQLQYILLLSNIGIF